MVRGGAETRTVELLRYIDRKRYLPQFLSLSGLPGQLDDEIRQLGSEVHLCKLERGFSRRFTELLKEEQFDIVHSHIHFSSGYILRLAEKAGVRGRISHFRNTQDGHDSTLRRMIQRAISRWMVNRHSTNILSVGTGTMETLFGKNWSKDPRRTVIPNGVDGSRFAAPPDRIGVRREFGLANDCPLVIHVGNLRKQKNHPFLISVFEAIQKHIPAARLILVGHGDSDTELKVRAQVDELKLAESVIFAGSRSDVPRLLSAADIMVFPSKWEGLPGAVLEAAAAGIPVIGSDIPGIIELSPHLPIVEHLALEAGPKVWAQVACERIADGYDYDRRKSIQKCFGASPYTIEKCAALTCSVWRRASKIDVA